MSKIKINYEKNYYAMMNHFANKKDKVSQVKYAILVAFDCPTHFHKPTIIENDDFFKLVFPNCRKRLEEALEL